MPLIDPALPMGELLQRYPAARRTLFQQYHLGGCASCAFSQEETLAEVCARNGNLPVAEVIQHILAGQEEDARLQVAPREAQHMVAEGQAQLVDLRTREEYEAVHIEGSTFFTQAMMHELPGWDRARLIIFVDHHGTRSLDAAAYFLGHGVPNVRALQGGIHAWSEEVDASVPQYDLEPA